MLLNLFRHYSWLGPVWISQLGLIAFLHSALAHSYPIFGHVISITAVRFIGVNHRSNLQTNDGRQLNRLGY